MKKESLVVVVIVALLASSCLMRGKRHETLEGVLPGHGVSHEVRIVYDRHGVAHLMASNDRDLFYGVGYAMAQDRFFFMDLARRIGRGEISWMFGRSIRYKHYDSLTADKLMRAFDFTGRAEQGVAGLLPREREMLEAYTEGVNRYLADAGNRLPEYRALGRDAEPWTMEDCFVCMDLYGLSMTLWSLFHEYYGARLIEELGADRAGIFMMHYPGDSTYINQDRLPTASLDPFFEILSGVGMVSNHIGSNNWVVDGTMSASGMPMLANDPHVPHILAPAFWWHVHLAGGSYDAAGLMFSGIPVLASGTNGRVAWGITNARCDYIDLFVEKVNPENPDLYFYKGEWKDFERVREKVKVKRGLNLEYTWRRSVHGFVIDEAVTNGIESARPEGSVYALHLNEVDYPRFLRGYLAIPRAEDAGDMYDAIRDMGMGPVAWNTVYATVEGDIGYLYSGHAPVRPNNRGDLPRTGTGEQDWQGWIPFHELPHAMNPEKHFIATANNKVEGPGYPYYLCSGYNLPSRADRITEMLAGRKGLRVKDHADIQTDVKVRSAEKFVPLFLEDLAGAEGPEAETCRRLLAEWHEQGCFATLDSKGTGVYKLMMRQMVKLTFADELGAGYVSKLNTAEMAVHALWDIMPDRRNEWFDNVDTPRRETRKDVSRLAAIQAYEVLKGRLGKDPDEWRWGSLQKMVIRHPLGMLPWNKRARVGTFEIPGTEESVSNASSMFLGPVGYMVFAGPSSRIIVDMAEPRTLYFNATAGNSENPDSPMFDLPTRDWLAGDYRAVSMDEDVFKKGAIGELTLAPR